MLVAVYLLCAQHNTASIKNITHNYIFVAVCKVTFQHSSYVVMVKKHSSKVGGLQVQKRSRSESFLSSCHEKTTEALCIERIQTHLGVALVSKFSV